MMLAACFPLDQLLTAGTVLFFVLYGSLSVPTLPGDLIACKYVTCSPWGLHCTEAVICVHLYKLLY